MIGSIEAVEQLSPCWDDGGVGSGIGPNEGLWTGFALMRGMSGAETARLWDFDGDSSAGGKRCASGGLKYGLWLSSDILFMIIRADTMEGKS